MVPIIQPELLGKAGAVDVPSATGPEYYEGSNCDLFPSAASLPSKGSSLLTLSLFLFLRRGPLLLLLITYLASKPTQQTLIC